MAGGGVHIHDCVCRAHERVWLALELIEVFGRNYEEFLVWC